MPTNLVNGVELYHEEHGTGANAIVFVHGFFTSSRMWRESFLSHLPERYKSYAIDLRGHGRSNRVTRGCNLVQLADDVYQWSLRLGIAPFHYVGVSMGGGVGVQLAIEHPEVLQRLVVMNSVTGFGLIAPRVLSPLLPLLAGKRRLLEKMLRSGFTRRPPDETLRMLLRDAMLVSRQTCAEWFHPRNRMGHLDRLAAVEVPTLVMIGGRDKVLPIDRQHRLAQTLPNAKKVVFEDAGHMMALEIPEAACGAATSFLEE